MLAKVFDQLAAATGADARRLGKRQPLQFACEGVVFGPDRYFGLHRRLLGPAGPRRSRRVIS